MRNRTFTLSAILLATSCASDRASPPGDVSAPAISERASEPPMTDDDGKRGLFFSLEEASAEAPPTDAVPRAKATPLSAPAAAALLSRLEPLEAKADDVVAFRLRKGSRPAPKTGEVVTTAFPPADGDGAPAPTDRPGPLSVLRVAPEGEVHTVPRVSVTFSRPMVPISGIATIDAMTRPARVTPEPAGQWRWVGTQTLIFEPKGRLPMATDYVIDVPAGVGKQTGPALTESHRVRFSTPPPELVRVTPSGKAVERQPVITLAFDQRVDPTAVLAHLDLEAAGGRVDVRLATPAEIEADPAAKAWTAQAPEPGRMVSFIPKSRMPADAAVKVTLQAGLPSAEGPRTTKAAQTHAMRTYPALKVEEVKCGWRNECRPLMPWSVRFNNPLDPERFEPEQVRVEPEVPGLQAVVSHTQITLRGPTKGRTTYRVLLSPDITDRFGQKLGPTDPFEIAVGGAQPAMMISGGAMTALDPEGPRAMTVHVVNYPRLAVRMWSVDPSDWPRFLDWMRDRKAPGGPGKLVFDDELKTGAPQDELHEYRIALDAGLAKGLGHVVVEVQPPRDLLPKRQRDYPPIVRQWVQSTRLAADAFVGPRTMLAWVTRLTDGAPVDGAQVTLAPGQGTVSSAKDGLAQLDLPASWRGDGARVIVQKGDDVAFLPESEWRTGGTNWVQRTQRDQLRLFAFDDRGLYRPGESVRIKGWLRTITAGPTSDVGGAPAGLRQIGWKVFDPRGNQLAAGSSDVGRFGGFDLTVALPDDANLGRASVRFEAQAKGAPKGSFHHSFQIQEFRRPEFEVAMSSSEGPHLVGSAPVLTAEAHYFAGGGLAAARVQWNLHSSPGSYSPPGHDRFQFGHTPVWWWSGSNSGHDGPRLSHVGTTDASGAHRLRVNLDRSSPPRPYVLHAAASIQDVNRQTWAANTDLLVHPSRHYVGLRPARSFVSAGEVLQVEHIVADIDGEVVAGRNVRLVAERLEWKQRGGDWKEAVAETLTCDAVSAAEAGTCRFEPEEGGRYRLRARVADSDGRVSETQTTIWVGGGKAPPQRTVTEEVVQLVPDKDEYAPGDVAEILVVAPFADAHGLLTLRREGFLHKARFEIRGSTHVLKIPITEGHLPALGVYVDLTGAAPRHNDRGEVQDGLPKRPAHGSGQISLPVPPKVRELTVVATPADAELAPGGKTTVKVTVTDAAGRPVDAEVALVVVDEAVLALAGYALKDPMALFYQARAAGIQEHRFRQQVVLGNPDDVSELASGGGGDADMAFAADAAPGAERAKSAPMMRSMAVGSAMPPAPPEPAGPAIAVRSDFSALAHYSAAVLTGSDGQASVPIALPDNLTRYRVMAVAVDDGRRFGKAESQVVARMPLMIRPSPPRFLSYGDHVELPVVLQNQTNAPIDVQVALRATNLDLGATTGYATTVAAKDRVEVRFSARAAKPGTARFQVAAAAGAYADAAALNFPVYTPATTEAFATYGTVTKGIVRQPVLRPEEAVTEFGGLTISTASTQLQALTDAFIYVLEYPFGCSEQVASRLLSVAALKDVLAAFDAPGLPPEKELLGAVDRDIAKLVKLQNGDGGWGFWRRGQTSWPFLTVHVVHALARAEEAGFEVPKNTMVSGRRYLQQIEQHIARDYPVGARRGIVAYALYVRALMGDLDSPAALALLEQVGGPKQAPLELLGWLYPVLIDGKGTGPSLKALRRHLASRVTEEAGTAHFVTSYSEGAHLLLHSSRRVDGLLLEGILRDTPKSDLVPKLARGLLAHRTKGRWGNTQENAWVLLALNRYFRTYERVTPDFVARVWLGEGYAGDHTFEGRTTETHQVTVPMDQIPDGGPSDLVIQRDGKGRLYYRIGLSYAPRDLNLDPMERGFSVTRTYEAVDDPADVEQDTDGTWTIKAGARVRVKLQMVAPTRRYHVALVDKLPAGFEPLNPDLAMTEVTPASQRAANQRGPYWWWSRPWYEHENLRDERVEAFSTLVWAGVHEYTYVARATTPGRYTAPPAKAEEMYAPEVFGRSGTARVVVK